MKDSDIQELKPVYIHEAHYSAHNEISLIDFTMILVRRKKMIVVVTTLIIALGVIIALLKPESYTFTTSIEIGSQIIGGTIEPFESPQTLLAKTQYVFIPQAQNEQRQTNPEDIKIYKIKAYIPKNSVIIVLEIKGPENKADLIKRILRNVTQQAIQDHRRIYDAVKKNLIALKEQSKTELISLNPKEINLTEKRSSIQENNEIQKSQLANLRNTREILPPMRSIEPTGTSGKLIIIITTFVGIFLGVFSAFFAEFLSIIKQKTDKK